MLVIQLTDTFLRYLRLGDEEDEFEQKLLNYWIGIEHIFSSPNKEERLITKIAKKLSSIHSISYFTRNIENLHRTIKRIGLDDKIPSYDEKDYRYLLKEDSYKELINAAMPEYPLMGNRAVEYRGRISDNKLLVKWIRKNERDIHGNLFRIYRVRNEIVHNAATKNNITELTSHLQYYLLFMITSILDFFNERPTDLNFDDKITIEDYFIHFALIHESLEDKDIKPEVMIAFNNPLSVHLE